MKFSVAAALHHQIEPSLQRIEVWSALAIPSFRVVGLPGPEIIESCERVRAAIESSGFEFPKRRVLVNLSPAGIKKQGTGTDLAIALAILMKRSDLQVVASAELGLDGSIRSAGRVTRTCLAAVLHHATHLVLAREDHSSALRAIQLIQRIYPEYPLPSLCLVSTLPEALESLTTPFRMTEREHLDGELAPPERDPRLPEDLLIPHPSTMRKILACSAGAHSLLLLGPKGTGKTAALKWLVELRESLRPEDLLEQLKVNELLPIAARAWSDCSPVREISPQVRAEALIGGVQRGQVLPGELSLAHGGILVADEFLEWRRDAREALRDPLESGKVVLQRAHQSLQIPARFIFAASANLCPCGGTPPEMGKELSAQALPCICSPRIRREYLERLSGPILDRIDCVEWMGAVSREGRVSESLWIRSQDQVRKARELLCDSWGDLPGRLSPAQLESAITQNPKWSTLQSQWGTAQASLRRRHREIRLALSLAAIDGKRTPEPQHFLDARPLPVFELGQRAQVTPIHFLHVSKTTPRARSLTPGTPPPYT